MKRKFIIILATLAIASCSPPTTRAPKAEEQREESSSSKMPIMLNDSTMVGEFDLSDVRARFRWFDSTFNAYTPNPATLEKLKPLYTGAKILCFAGTWCSDTRRELPRLWRILFESSTDPDMMTMIGIDRQKMSPNGESIPFNIRLSPTFIILRNGAEIGRIEEKPIATLEEELLSILLK